jgi:hypothetical protein
LEQCKSRLREFPKFCDFIVKQTGFTFFPVLLQEVRKNIRIWRKKNRHYYFAVRQSWYTWSAADVGGLCISVDVNGNAVNGTEYNDNAGALIKRLHARSSTTTVASATNHQSCCRRTDVGENK